MCGSAKTQGDEVSRAKASRPPVMEFLEDRQLFAATLSAGAVTDITKLAGNDVLEDYSR